jgi:hypothetical protein
MKHVALILAGLVLGGLILPARHAYAWPDAIEAFNTAMQTGDAPAALAALADNAVVTIPGEMVPPDSKLLPSGSRAAHVPLILTGKAQIAAWLAEFTGPYHGRMYIRGPAHGNNGTIIANAAVIADNLREVFANWPVGSVDMTLKGDRLTAVTLTLPEEDLQALRRANPQAYSTPQPARHGTPTGPRVY